jgi:hypothetical protein
MGNVFFLAVVGKLELDPTAFTLLCRGCQSTVDPSVRDGKNIRILDPGFRMNIPDHFSESLGTVLGLILCCGSGYGIQNLFGLDPGSGINIPDLPHWLVLSES